ncbi:MAG: 16S rRNA (cytidine(1402)-2'-O)-methyltransferase [Acidimicrobiia bacterium]|nr:16S rRNA (cytidine(1402)-2'-O)-methyltransferase [Acidimicrobiia bacterium]
MSGRLTVCASPIGNLGDAPPRLAEVLAAADLVLAEDTRRSKVLLDVLGVSTRLESYFIGNEEAKSHELGERLRRGEHVALLTDAGTPAVSDPGLTAVLVAQEVGAIVSVVPGPSAATAALSISGLPSERFVFEGFLPRRGQDRVARLTEVGRETRTVVLFSAPARLVVDLDDLAGACGRDRRVVVTRELTKVHEEVWRGTLGQALDAWSERRPRGEFTLVIAGATAERVSVDDAMSEVRRRIAAGDSLSAAVREVADVTGVRRRDLYQAALSEATES